VTSANHILGKRSVSLTHGLMIFWMNLSQQGRPFDQSD